MLISVLWNCLYADCIGGKSEFWQKCCWICCVAAPSTNLDMYCRLLTWPQIIKTKLKIWLLQQWLNHGNLPTRRELTSSEWEINPYCVKMAEAMISEYYFKSKCVGHWVKSTWLAYLIAWCSHLNIFFS